MKDILINGVYNIIERYTWEFNNKDTRYKICMDLSNLLGVIVLDHTDISSEQKGSYIFMVQINENYSVSLIDYLENYNIYQRSKKLKKILKN